MATKTKERATQGGDASHPCQALVAKLNTVVDLPGEDEAALGDICVDVRRSDPRTDIISEGDRPNHVHVMVDGWAARYKDLPDGGRQITAFLLPGDFCDIHVTILERMDHGILALTPASVAFIPHQRMQELPRDRPVLAQALWWCTLVDEAILRAWLVNLGRRSAMERVAHLMCELHLRMDLLGLVQDDRFDLPLTQDVLADAVGLTTVHVNRTLRKLRTAGLIEFSHGTLTILDVAGLRGQAGFDPAYLHGGCLARRPRGLSPLS